MRATLLLPLGLLVLACAAWFLFVRTSPRSAPSPSAVHESPGESLPERDGGLDTITARSTAGDAEIAGDAVSAAKPEERHTVARGRGRLQLELHAPSAIIAEPFVLGLVPEEPENPAPARTLVRSPERTLEPVALELPAGSYRVFVVSGPGDPRDTEQSRAWAIDEFDDVVQVIANQTSRDTVKITTAVEAAPPRGVARISGLAFLDGAPATNCFVTTGPLTRSRIVRVNPDGSFDLGEVEAGSLRVQLSEPTDGFVRDAFLARLAHLDVAPAPGEALAIRLEARTGRCQVMAFDSSGRPVAGSVDVLGVPAFAVPGFNTDLGNGQRMSRWLSTDAAVTIDTLPAGRIGLVVRSHGYTSDPVWFDLLPGETEVVRVPVRTLTEIRVNVDWDSYGAPERASASVTFRGPTTARVAVNRRWRGTAYLLPGEYAVEVQFPPVVTAAIAAQPLVVEAGEPQPFLVRPAR